MLYDLLLLSYTFQKMPVIGDDNRQKQSGKNDNNEFPLHKMQMSKKSPKRYYYLESSGRATLRQK